MGGFWYTVLCIFDNQEVHDKTCRRGLTVLRRKGAMLSTNATPPRILFFLDNAKILSVVNTGISHQRTWW